MPATTSVVGTSRTAASRGSGTSAPASARPDTTRSASSGSASSDCWSTEPTRAGRRAPDERTSSRISERVAGRPLHELGRIERLGRMQVGDELGHLGRVEPDEVDDVRRTQLLEHGWGAARPAGGEHGEGLAGQPG